MTSNIILYKACEIDKDKNFILDNLSAYLASLTQLTFTNSQYVKNAHELSLSIKLDLGQAYLSNDWDNSLNYCSIKNSDNIKTYYYFVTGYKWLSEGAIKLDLLCDVLNTYKAGEDFTISDKTKIIREHRNRLRKVADADSRYYSGDAGDIDFNITAHGHYREIKAYIYIDDVDLKGLSNLSLGVNSNIILQVNGEETLLPLTIYEYDSASGVVTLYGEETYSTTSIVVTGFAAYVNIPPRFTRLIDLVDEGLTPVLYKNDSEDMNIKEKDSSNWYLVFKTQAGANMFITNESGLSMQDVASGSPFTIQASDLSSAKEYYIDFATTGNPTPSPSVYAGFVREVELYSTSDNTASGTKTHTAKTTLEYNFISRGIMVVFRKRSDGYIEFATKTYNYNDILSAYEYVNTSAWVNTYKTTIFLACNENFVVYEGSPSSARSTIRDYTTSSYTITTGVKEVKGFNVIDRTDSTLIKIIKLPYCPIAYTIDANGVYHFTRGEYDVTTGLIRLNSNEKLNKIIDSSYNPLQYLSLNKEIDYNSERDDNLESKLYNSHFYNNKFVYDSFGFIFELEKVDAALYEQVKEFSISYVVTTTINSRFMFQFNGYTLNKSNSDYSNVLLISRNNEMTLYNDEYINYLRTGYNYDVKNKNRSEATSWISTILSLAGAVASFASSGATGAAGIAAGVTLSTSAVASFTSALNTTIGQEQSINSRLASLEAQAASVSGSDDVDLLDVYTDNVAKICTYRVSDKVRKMLADLFYFFGYNAGYTGIPNTNTRYWFNFLQADIMIEEERQLNEDVKEQVSALYSAGVTFLHYHSGYDFSQSLENWENDL